MMEILIPSAASAAIILLILSSPHHCVCLTSYKTACTLRQSLRAKIVEDINKEWEKEFLEGKKLDEGAEILGYDVVALYLL
jgi:hypothetical protein